MQPKTIEKCSLEESNNLFQTEILLMWTKVQVHNSYNNKVCCITHEYAQNIETLPHDLTILKLYVYRLGIELVLDYS